ncbi:MAG: VWA domain-containing protein [Bryobacteraceae bacterium]|nr:VWA domain-containing protein [Bryobacteraceae bacterium]
MLSLSGSWQWAGRIAVGIAIFTAAAGSAGGQERFASGIPSFRIDATLVLVPVTVVDRRGSIVNGLAKDAFTLTENGVPQQIRSFSQQDVPVSMGIVLDLSGSMQRVAGTAKESLRALLKDANPADEAFLNAVSTRPRAYSGFTRDFDAILSKIAFENASGSTALIDTIYASLQQLRSGVHARKALLVISDGMDNHSRYSREELLRFAVEADAQVHTIAVGFAPQTAKPIELMEEKKGTLFLEELAAKTGGLSVIVQRQSDIEKAATSIGQALRNQYAIGYIPDGPGHAGLWRRIKVRVAGQGMRAYARAGYRLESEIATAR